MSPLNAPAAAVRRQLLQHLLGRVEATAALDSPFSHFYLEEVFPPALYQRLLGLLPGVDLYAGSAERHREGEGHYVRTVFALDHHSLPRLSAEQRDLWTGIAAALTAPALKEAVFAKLARDLAYRFGVRGPEVGQLAGYCRPILYRETEGFEIPPHPDTRKKIVTMHLYLPADRSQLELGTALYRRRILAWPFGSWRHRFVKVKQFPFQPNSGYAFVVNNTMRKKSWHGRERLPAGAGVRNTLLMTFYGTPREGFLFEEKRQAA